MTLRQYLFKTQKPTEKTARRKGTGKKKPKRFTNQSKTTEENSQTCNSGSFKVEVGGVNLGSADK
jgi:hypothetical protein